MTMLTESFRKKVFVTVIFLGVFLFVVQKNMVTVILMRKPALVLVNDSLGASAPKKNCENFRFKPPIPCGNQWKEQYKALHRRIINNQQSQRFLVYYCGEDGGCGGYGNRLFAIVSLFYLAVLTDRAFIIHWKYPDPLERYLIPNEIQWNYSLHSLEKYEHRRHWWSNYRKNIQKKKGWCLREEGQSLSEFAAHTNFSSYFNKPVEIVALLKDTTSFMQKNPSLKKRILAYDVTPFRHTKGREMRYRAIGCGFNFLFRKAKHIETIIMNKQKEIHSTQALTIGLQIRTGDESFGQQRNTSWFLKTAPLSSFFACAQKVEDWLLERAGNHSIGGCQITWFIATDNMSVKAYVKKHFPHRAATLDFKPVHIEIQSGKEMVEDYGMTTVLLDHFFLSRCDFLILTEGSTFGETAAGLSMRKKHLITYGGKCRVPGSDKLIA